MLSYIYGHYNTNIKHQFSLLTQCVRFFMTPWIAVRQASLSITNSQSLPKLMSIESVCRSTISSSVVPFCSCLQSFPASGSFPMSQYFTSGGQSIRVSASVSVLPVNIQGLSPCTPRDSQKSSPKPQFKSINSLVLSFLYSPTLTSLPCSSNGKESASDAED